MRLDPIILRSSTVCVCVQSQPKTFFQFSRLKVARQSAPQTIRMLGRGATNRLALVPTPLSDDHSRVEPPLPIPNRTVKRSRANDSRHSPVKVGHRQTPYSYPKGTQNPLQKEGVFYWPISLRSNKLTKNSAHDTYDQDRRRPQKSFMNLFIP